MIVRRGAPADIPALAELQEIEREHLGTFAAWVAAHEDTHLPFVADIDGAVVGAAWLHVTERIPRRGLMDRRFGDVQSVMVREEHRSGGIGAALMAAILAEARTRKLSHVTVHSGRRAINFYARNGFRHDDQILLWRAADHRPGGLPG